MVTVVGLHDINEACLKHTNTLKTVDRDAQGGVNVVRKVSEHSNSLRDLKDFTHPRVPTARVPTPRAPTPRVPTPRVQGVRRGASYPFESDSALRNANAKEHATKRLIQTSLGVYGYVI